MLGTDNLASAQAQDFTEHSPQDVWPNTITSEELLNQTDSAFLATKKKKKKKSKGKGEDGGALQ